jgi:parvulin-like peptidyl-prolyl isomerase
MVHPVRQKTRRLTAGALITLLNFSTLILAALIGTVGCTAERSKTEAPAPATAAAPDPLDGVVAESKFGPLTRREMLDYAEDARIEALRGLSPNNQLAKEQIVAMDADRLTSAARYIVSRLQAHEWLMTKANAAQREQLAANFEQGQKKVTIINRIINEAIGDKLPNPSDEEIKGYYDQHLPEFRRPFQFFMRHLVLLTYEPYVAQDGDTLEAIASRIGGDAAQADEIRMDSSTRPLRREQDKEFKPLVPGEHLLVPMEPDKAAEVRLQLENHLKELRSGVTFEDLCRRHSQSERAGELVGPLPSGTRPMLPEFEKLAHETPEGKVSPVFRTPHGWQAIEIVKKQEEGHASLEDTRSIIVDRLLRDKRDELSLDLARKMFDNPRLVIDFDAIVNRTGEMTPDTVVASLDDQQVTWQQFGLAWERGGKPKTEEGIVEALRRVRELQEILLLDMAREGLQSPESEISRAVERARRLTNGDGYLATIGLLEARAGLTTETLLQYYEEHKDSNFKAAPKVTFKAIERRATPNPGAAPAENREAMRQLFDILLKEIADVQSPEQFLELAAQVNKPLEGAEPPVPGSDEPVSFDELDPRLRAIMEPLNPRQWSDPLLLDNNRIVSVLVTSKVSEGYRPFEEVADEVRQLALQKAFGQIIEAKVEQALEEAAFQSKL